MKKCGYCLQSSEDSAGRCWFCKRVDHFHDSPAVYSLLRSMQSRLSASVVSDLAQGVDYSTWQDSPTIPGHIDHAKMATLARFAFVKKSQATHLDADYLMNWDASQGHYLRGPYHYLDWSQPAEAQAEFFCDGLAESGNELPGVIDHECTTNAPSPGTAREELKRFAKVLIRAQNKKPALYTAPGYWATYGSADSWWRDNLDLWEAHWYVNSPKSMAPWGNDWRFWQYSEKGDGAAYGVESKQIDLDYFNGSVNMLNEYANGSVIVVPPPTDYGDMWFRALVDNQNVSSQPRAGIGDIGKLTAGDIIKAYDIYSTPSLSNGVWAKIAMTDGRVGWAAVYYGGKMYLESA